MTKQQNPVIKQNRNDPYNCWCGFKICTSSVRNDPSTSLRVRL